MKFSLSLLFLCTVLGSFSQEQTSSGTTNFNPTQFDSYVEQAVKEWDVPGLAIAVIKGDSVLFVKGYGVREMGKQEPVDIETLFAIASTTKAFTAAAIGILVDEGKLKWDDPVVKHLPEFKLKDPDLTRQITVRDLLTHRAGLPNTDFLWTNSDAPTAEIIRRLENVEAAYPLRSGFVYQNVMYALAGQVIGAVSGSSWGEFVRERILNPLQMERTASTRATLNSSNNITVPHDYAGGKLVVVQDSQADAIGPAGSMWSNVSEMSRWMQFLLRGCETESGEKLLKQSTCEELFRPQALLSGPSYPTAELTDANWHTYGLGWFQQDYEGRKVDFHTGSLSGTVALAGMIRDENIGIYVLANRDHAELRHALMYRVFDLFDNDPPRDWSTEIKHLYDARDEKQKAAFGKTESEITAGRATKTKPSLPLTSYAGTYEHPLYGTVEITHSVNELRFQYGGTKGNLEHWHYDTFRLKNEKPENESRPLVNFDLNSSGKVQRVRIYGREFSR